MEPVLLQPEIAARLADLYGRMEEAYDQVAGQLGFGCQGCEDNCCDSYFLHHTYVEWAYLWEGLQRLEQDRLEKVVGRARMFVNATMQALAAGEQPAAMCPLNAGGRCSLYSHRLMICRLHGVPASLTFPNGRIKEFPGCFRCQELTGDRQPLPRLERGGLLAELAGLERELLASHPGQLPRVKKTIAEMIIQGPPQLRG